MAVIQFSLGNFGKFGVYNTIIGRKHFSFTELLFSLG